MLKKILEHTVVLNTIEFLDSIKLKSGISLFFLMETFYNKMKEDDIQTMASAIAYNFTLSLFPGIIFLFTLIPYIPIDELTNQIQLFMQEGLPESVYNSIWGTVEHVIDNKNGSLLSFGFLMAIYLSKNGMLAIMTAFNNVYTTKESRGFIKKQILAIMLTFLFVFCIFSAVIVIVFGNQIVYQIFDFLNMKHAGLTELLISALRYSVIFIMFLVIISLIYYVAPTVKRKLNFFSAGSFTATILILIVAKAFAFYVDNFGNYNKLYGTIGAMLGLMFFFFAVSLILLVGFQVNASIDKARSEFED